MNFVSPFQVNKSYKCSQIICSRVHYYSTGCPTSNQAASMGLNYDLGDKSENLRRMNHLKEFNKANRKFCWQKMLDFSRIICVFWG